MGELVWLEAVRRRRSLRLRVAGKRACSGDGKDPREHRPPIERPPEPIPEPLRDPGNATPEKAPPREQPREPAEERPAR
jgi:hypothetical protein